MIPANDSGIRRRHIHDWDGTSPGRDEEDTTDQEIVFEDEQPTIFQEYYAIFGEYVFWILMAYCVLNIFLWIGEKLGYISPQFEEWNPARWWHSNPHDLQKELYQNATQHALTVAQFDGLKRWIESVPGGWVSPKLLVSDFLSERGRYDRRLEVQHQVEKDEVLIKLPLSRVLSADFCQQELADTVFQSVVVAKKQNSDMFEMSPWTWIALYLIALSRKAWLPSMSDSLRFDGLFKDEYVDASLSYTPIFWDDENLQWLNGSDLAAVHVLDVHAAMESEYQKILYLVSSIESTLSIIDFKKWAMLVMSRGVSVNLPDPKNKTQTVPQLAIMPMMDLVDHHLPMPTRRLSTSDELQEYQENGSHTNVSYREDMSVVVLEAREPLNPASAVTAGYGVRSNGDYLLYHGFTMGHKWSDLTLCAQYAMITLPLPLDMPAWKSRFLSHPYRFAVPACPTQKSTPHVVVGAARFLVASDKDVVEFEERLMMDPTLVEGSVVPKDDKFLHHQASEAVKVVCSTEALPPLCRSPLSPKNEKAAWEAIRTQTIARVAQHAGTIEQDNMILLEDDEKDSLTVNQRHAVIVRREEKLSLRQWCGVVAKITDALRTAADDEFGVVRLPDAHILENDEPRVRPRYWARLLEPVSEAEIPEECHPK
eukprot:TRINITY_DN9490_c0_g1_i1.p1 TRINITY_DN9490_c0_g1~~TRINITY_DN9490_c0_g1_i1.p1  ORF type:complete len:652 (-),score=102.33 TRINITY_DN9490_c0_g1_i1:71-2026(-)